MTSKKKLMSLLEKKFNIGHIRDASDFYGYQSKGIWMSGESSNFVDKKGDLRMFDYYSEGKSYENFGVHKDVADFLESHGWYGEWHDAGTMMLFPI